MDGEAKEKLIKNFDLRKEIVTKLDIKQYDGKKLKESILVTIAQNITDVSAPDPFFLSNSYFQANKY